MYFLRSLLSVFDSTIPQLDAHSITMDNQDALGSGGIGVVRGATWRLPGGDIDKVAIKAISRKKGVIAGSSLKIASMLEKNPHANIVRIHGYFYIRNYYIVMEYSPLGSLDGYMAQLRGRGQTYSWSYTGATHAIGVANGMAHLHDLGIIHRDIKAANVLIFSGESGTEAKLIDFDSSVCFRSIAGEKVPWFGSSFWMAPEFFNGRCTFASDTYSFGVLLLEMTMTEEFEFEQPLTSATPSDDLPAQVILMNTHQGNRLRISDEVYEPVKLIIKKCWCAKPEDRISDERLVTALKASFTRDK